METTLLNRITSKQEALDVVYKLSYTTKMPCPGYSISAFRCQTGSKLVDVKDSVCSGCYAMRGWYGARKVIQDALEKRYQALFNPLWVEAMTFLVHYYNLAYFRWHDSGDLQGTWHLAKICEIAWLCPTVSFWLPTREWDIVRRYVEDEHNVIPENLTVRLSAHLIDGPGPTELAKRLGVTTSGVSSDGSHTCEAYSKMAPANSGKYKEWKGYCGSCRNCWDPTVQHVTYLYHNTKRGPQIGSHHKSKLIPPVTDTTTNELIQIKKHKMTLAEELESGIICTACHKIISEHSMIEAYHCLQLLSKMKNLSITK